MLFAIAAVLGIALALLSGGSLRSLGRIRIRGEAVLLVALVAVVGVPIIGRRWPESSETIFWVWVAAFVGLAVVAALNLRSPGFGAILTGVLLNLSAILVNAGMPVSFGSMLAAGYAGAAPPDYLGPFGLHHLAGWGTSLLLVADVTPIQGPVLLRTIVSIGDVLLLVGVVAFIVSGATTGDSQVLSNGRAAEARPNTLRS